MEKVGQIAKCNNKYLTIGKQQWRVRDYQSMCLLKNTPFSNVQEMSWKHKNTETAMGKKKKANDNQEKADSTTFRQSTS